MSEFLAYMHSASLRGPLPGLVWAFRSDGSGKACELTAGQPIANTGEGWHWLHFNLADQQTNGLLEALPGLPRQAAMLLKEREEIPQIHSESGITYGVIADLQRAIGSTNDDIGLLYFVMSERILVTGRRTHLNAPGAMRVHLSQGQQVQTVEDLLAAIIEQVVDGIDVYLERIAREVDGLEDRIISGSTGDARARLARYRRTTVRLRRQISELRLLFQRLERDSKRLAFPPALVALAVQLFHDSEQLDRDIIALSDRTRLLQEEVVTLLTEETNKHLRVLSVLTILFLPPTFIAGLFGMNLKGMLFEGHDLGFWSATVLAVASSAVVLWLLRRAGVTARPNTD